MAAARIEPGACFQQHGIEALYILFNHPDFVGIIPILLENPESRPICDWDRKNSDFDSCCDIFVKVSYKKTKCRILDSDVPKNWRNCKKYQRFWTEIVVLEHQKWLLRSSRFKNFQTPPSKRHLRRLRQYISENFIPIWSLLEVGQFDCRMRRRYFLPCPKMPRSRAWPQVHPCDRHFYEFGVWKNAITLKCDMINANFHKS